VQRAAPRLLARLPELQAPIAARVRGNLEALRERVAGSRATLLRVEGGWSAVLQVPATLSEEDRTCRLLEERGVLVHPGFFFDFEREAFLVLSLLPPPETFLPAVAAILADASEEPAAPRSAERSSPRSPDEGRAEGSGHRAITGVPEEDR
jgi:hypothetical protein